ncbi:pyroglutamyl-peptidase I [Natronoglycomyces albus]|uniref:pyroglutamyl-peptidase I n=1 Tax=Natronoglycomyces albus TaxID=2811108 RepID=UPI0031B5C81B
MPKVLLTGFEPFGGEQTNPSWEAVELACERLSLPTTAVELPVSFADSALQLREAIATAQPDLVLCLGQAAGRAALTIERVALNLIDAPIPDNAQAQPIDEPVVAQGPAAYFAALPVKACVEASRAVGVPAAASLTAGTYVCNSTFYYLSHLIATEYPSLKGGFIHVPLSPKQGIDGGQATLDPSAVATALVAIVHTALRVDTDIASTGGQTH